MTTPSVPAGLALTKEKTDRASDNHYFILVHRGKGGVRHRYLSGAEKLWTSPTPADNQVIYSLDYRVTGLPADVEEALRSAGVSPADASAAVSRALSASNYKSGTNAALYQAELAARDKNRQVKKPAAEPSISNAMLKAAARAITQRDFTTVSSGKTETRTPSASARGSSSETLATRSRKLQEGRVIDVSTWDAATNRGGRVIVTPKGYKAGKAGAGPVVADSLDKVLAALHSIHPNGNAKLESEARKNFEEMTAAKSAKPLTPVTKASVQLPLTPVTPVVSSATASSVRAGSPRRSGVPVR